MDEHRAWLGHLNATFNIWAVDWATVNSFEKHTLKQVQYLAYCQQITANWWLIVQGWSREIKENKVLQLSVIHWNKSWLDCKLQQNMGRILTTKTSIMPTFDYSLPVQRLVHTGISPTVKNPTTKVRKRREKNVSQFLCREKTVKSFLRFLSKATVNQVLRCTNFG